MSIRGEIHPVTGLVFWQAFKKAYGKNRVTEVWLNPGEFARRHTNCLSRKHAHYTANARAIAQANRQWATQNPSSVKKMRIAWMAKGDNRQRCNAGSRASKRKHRITVRAGQQRWRKTKMQTDPLFRLKIACRKRITQFLRQRRMMKTGPGFALLGCTVEFLKAHLQDQFKPGMSWDNYGAWEIDHRKPLASAGTEPDVLALFHFTNLQPLWRIDNQRKGASCQI